MASALHFTMTVLIILGSSQAKPLSCEEGSPDAAAASAMLQVTRGQSPATQLQTLQADHDDQAPSADEVTKETKKVTKKETKKSKKVTKEANKADTDKSVLEQKSGLKSLTEVSNMHLQESLHCLPNGLADKHLSAMRYGASLLRHLLGSKSQDVLQLIDVSGKSAQPTEAPTEAPTPTGATASLDAAGFKATTSLFCPGDMETFFERLLESMNLKVCSKPHVQGLMHWFTGVPEMDFQYLIDVINNGNPCKYWADQDAVCPALSAECEGKWCR